MKIFSLVTLYWYFSGYYRWLVINTFYVCVCVLHLFDEITQNIDRRCMNIKEFIDFYLFFFTFNSVSYVSYTLRLLFSSPFYFCRRRRTRVEKGIKSELLSVPHFTVILLLALLIIIIKSISRWLVYIRLLSQIFFSNLNKPGKYIVRYYLKWF